MWSQSRNPRVIICILSRRSASAQRYTQQPKINQRPLKKASQSLRQLRYLLLVSEILISTPLPFFEPNTQILSLDAIFPILGMTLTIEFWLAIIWSSLLSTTYIHATFLHWIYSQIVQQYQLLDVVKSSMCYINNAIRLPYVAILTTPLGARPADRER